MKTLNLSDIDEDLKKTIIRSIDMDKILDYTYFRREMNKINLIQTVYGPDHQINEPPYLFNYELKKLYENRICDEEDIEKAIKRVRGRLINNSRESKKPSGGPLFKRRYY